MNDTFNLKRFARLFKKTLLERPMQLLGLIGLVLLLDLLFYFIGTNIKMVWEAVQELTFVWGFVGGGSFLAALIFNYFSSNANGSSYLTLPASSFEKWFTGVIIIGIFFPLIFLVFYHCMDLAFISSYHNSLDPKGPFYKAMYNAVFPFPYNKFVASKTYILFLNFIGAMLIGSLYYNKASFIKVALVCCALIIGGVFLNSFIANNVFKIVDRALPYYCVFVPEGKDFGKVLLPDYASKMVDVCLMYILPAILWLTTYVRLREKEF